MIVLKIPVFIICLAGSYLAGYIIGKRKKRKEKLAKGSCDNVEG